MKERLEKGRDEKKGETIRKKNLERLGKEKEI